MAGPRIERVRVVIPEQEQEQEQEHGPTDAR